MIIAGKLIQGGKTLTGGTDPKFMSGLIHNWDCSLLTGYVNGDNIPSIPNQVAGGAALTRVSNFSSLTYGKYAELNGRKGLTQAAANGESSAFLVGLGLNTNSAHTVIYIKTPIQLGTNQRVDLHTTTATQPGITYHTAFFNNASNMQLYNLANGTLNSPAVVNRAWIGLFGYSPTLVDRNVNSIRSRGAATTTSSASLNLYTSGGQSGATSIWHLNQVLVFNRLLTDVEQGEIFKWARRKWGTVQ